MLKNGLIIYYFSLSVKETDQEFLKLHRAEMIFTELQYLKQIFSRARQFTYEHT